MSSNINHVVGIRCPVHFMKYNKKADKFLSDFYRSVGAKTWTHKYNALMLKLGIEEGSQCFSHEPTMRQKVGMMEYELLHRVNLIELTLV
jgi:hypothetical protein